MANKRTTLLWCRDVENTWQTELQQGRAPEVLKNLAVPLEEVVPPAGRTARAYDPWKRVWTDAAIEDGAVRLPAFVRPIVVRLSSQN